jgi:hypothetical protein
VIRRLLSFLLPATMTDDEEIERTLQRLRQQEREPGLFVRMADHPVGFCILFFGGILVALGLAEILCTLVSATFDPRIG